MTLFVDASAIVAMIAGENDAARLANALSVDPHRITSAIARWEAIVALCRSHEFDWFYAQSTVEDFLGGNQIALVPIGAAEGQSALNAYGRYGKHRHPAALNMGDCFAYACAVEHDATLLYKGNDFAQTDLA